MPIWEIASSTAPNQPQSITQRVRAGNALPILSHTAMFDLVLFGHQALEAFYAQRIGYPYDNLPGMGQLANYDRHTNRRSDSSIDPNAFENEKPQQPLDLHEFYIGKYEVANAQYATCVKAGKCEAPVHWENGKIPLGNEDHPVVNVLWANAVAFTAWLSAETGQAFRLPTEAEWEKACRGTTGLIYPWRSRDIGPEKLNYNYNIGDTTPVGSYSPEGDSPYGAADMAGNVLEWTSSQYQGYPYDATDGRENLTDYEAYRVVRGGSFGNPTTVVRCALRDEDDSREARFEFLGFRVGFAPPSATGL